MGRGLSRRDVLMAGAGVAAAALAPRSWAVSSGSDGPQDPPLRAPTWPEVRGLFRLDPDRIHMAGLLLASHPKPVQAAIDRYRNELDRNPVDAYQDRARPEEQRAREAAAEYLNARPQDIALTGSTTQGLGIIYNGIEVGSEQEILSTVHDHQATAGTLNLRRDRQGTKLRRVQVYTSGVPTTGDEIVAKLMREVRPETRVLAVTWVHSSTGLRMPVPQIGAALRTVNASRDEKDRVLLCVDGVHGFGVEPLDVQAMGCDFLSAGCHKWLFGPRGTGIVYGRPESQKFLRACTISFSGGNSWGEVMTPGGFHSFEHRWALPEAFALHQRIGRQHLRERIHELARQCKEGLAKMPKVKLYTPMADELSAALVCFMVEGMVPTAVVDKLAERKIVASTTPYAVSYARLTPGLLNTPEEVDRTLAAIREIAG